MPDNHLFNGLTYLSRGAQLIVKPQLRWFVLVPILINLVLFVILTGILIQQFSSSMDWLLGWLPGWLDFLTWALWSFFAFSVLLIYGYSFSLITNLIAAPFYGLLADKTEAMVTGKKADSEPLRQMIPRTLKREVIKLGYFMVRSLALAIALLILSFIPPFNLLAPIIGFVWAAWCMAIQYVDYSADNHRLPFKILRNQLGKNKYSSLGFGGLVLAGTMVPLANIFIMPIAVVGGTLLWLEELKEKNNWE